MSSLQEEVLWRGASRAGQVLSYPVLQVPSVYQFAGPGRILLQGWRLLLHSRLPGPIRYQVRTLRPFRRRGSGHRSWQNLPQHMLHLRPMQVIVSFFLSSFISRTVKTATTTAINNRQRSLTDVGKITFSFSPFTKDKEVVKSCSFFPPWGFGAVFAPRLSKS